MYSQFVLESGRLVQHFLRFGMVFCALFMMLLPVSASADVVKAPELVGQPADWLNTNGQALHLYGRGGLLEPAADGKVHHIVLVDFWEYTCVNCIRTLPYVKAWYAQYHDDGLVVIGIHSPEFAFAHDGANVQAAVSRFGIQYPVVNDDAYRNWNAWSNDEWPREILIGSLGKIIEDHRGEGDYAATETNIRSALSQLNLGPIKPPAEVGPAQSVSPRTQELYCGYERGAGNYINAGEVSRDENTSYAAPSSGDYHDGGIGLSGEWDVTAESVRQVGSHKADYVVVQYHGPDCNAVMKPESGEPIKVLVFQDGQPLDKSVAGDDIQYDSSGQSYIFVDQPRMYSITRLSDPAEHTLTLQPQSAGFGLYSFSF
jgi:thiol-disulfide isomerase/thioredoxin